MKKAKNKKHRLPLLIVGSAVILMCLAAGAWAGRAFLRATAIPASVNAIYAPLLRHSFDSSFTPVNGLLKGIDAYSGVDKKFAIADGSCGLVSYEGFSESILCQRFQDTKGIVPTPQLVSDWKFGAPNLETYLLAHGWQKRDDQSITALFDNLREARWINYSKGEDPASCHLYLHYEGRPKPTTALSGDNKFYVTESCNRWVSF